MKLKLRRPERRDLDVVVDWLGDPAFRRFLYGDNERIKQQMGSHILALLGGAMSMPTSTAGHFICDVEERGPAGLASVGDLSWRNRSCSVSVYSAESLAPEIFYRGACFAIVEYCFDELNIHRVSMRVDAANTAARQAYEHLGATQELVLPRHGLRDGSPSDVYGYGVLRAEFDAARAGNMAAAADAGVPHGA
jgi:RimJ/RimL family protein N-acetyltransferase